jgi:hypothetical protein
VFEHSIETLESSRLSQGISSSMRNVESPVNPESWQKDFRAFPLIPVANGGLPLFMEQNNVANTMSLR